MGWVGSVTCVSLGSGAQIISFYRSVQCYNWVLLRRYSYGDAHEKKEIKIRVGIVKNVRVNIPHMLADFDQFVPFSTEFRRITAIFMSNVVDNMMARVQTRRTHRAPMLEQARITTFACFLRILPFFRVSFLLPFFPKKDQNTVFFEPTRFFRTLAHAGGSTKQSKKNGFLTRKMRRISDNLSLLASDTVTGPYEHNRLYI